MKTESKFTDESHRTLQTASALELVQSVTDFLERETKQLKAGEEIDQRRSNVMKARLVFQLVQFTKEAEGADKKDLVDAIQALRQAISENNNCLQNRPKKVE